MPYFLPKETWPSLTKEPSTYKGIGCTLYIIVHCPYIKFQAFGEYKSWRSKVGGIHNTLSQYKCWGIHKMHMEFQTMGNPFKLVVSADQRITKLEPLTNWLRSPEDRLGRWRCCHRSWYGATGGSGWTGTTGKWRHTHPNLMASWYGVKSLNLGSWRLDVLWREGAQSMERPKTKTQGTETSFQSKLIKMMMLQWKFVLTFRIFDLSWCLFYVYHVYPCLCPQSVWHVFKYMHTSLVIIGAKSIA